MDEEPYGANPAAMSRVFVHGIGAVSPAGWGVAALRDALASPPAIAAKEVARPGSAPAVRVRQVPTLKPRPPFLSHPRLRRASPISHYAVAAALEALGQDAPPAGGSARSLGVVLCVMSGCVNYSRRFYDETLRDPATASPLVFPETVFNAPASHVAALLGSPALNYTLVGDPGTFLHGLALAADWLATGQVEGCLVIGAEEIDWLTADAFRLFTRQIILSEGAGALYLKSEPSASAELRAITHAHLFFDRASRREAALKVWAELPASADGVLLCDGLQGVPRLDRPELITWKHWPGARLSPKQVLGEGLMAAAAWQTVAAVDAVQQGRHRAAWVSVVGCNEQAIGAQFVRAEERS